MFTFQDQVKNKFFFQHTSTSEDDPAKRETPVFTETPAFKKIPAVEIAPASDQQHEQQSCPAPDYDNEPEVDYSDDSETEMSELKL